MAITSEMIKKLRDQTGAGMMDCKRALESSNGDMNAAIEYLRKKGAAVAQKRADRAAKEGIVVTRVTPDSKNGIIVEVNTETDFVGRSEDFVKFAHAVAETVEKHQPAKVEALAGLLTNLGRTIGDLQNDLLSKVGEKIDIRRFDVFSSANGVVSSYTHLGNRIGVLVEFTGIDADEATKGVGRDIAMQIAAMSPLVVTRNQVDPKLIEKELDIYRTQAKNEKKPEHIAEKIAQGRLEKYFQEVVLMEQTFIKDGSKTITEVLQGAASKAGRPVTVKRFVRYHLGEETE